MPSTRKRNWTAIIAILFTIIAGTLWINRVIERGFAEAYEDLISTIERTSGVSVIDQEYNPSFWTQRGSFSLAIDLGSKISTSYIEEHGDFSTDEIIHLYSIHDINWGATPSILGFNIYADVSSSLNLSALSSLMNAVPLSISDGTIIEQSRADALVESMAINSQAKVRVFAAFNGRSKIELSSESKDFEIILPSHIFGIDVTDKHNPPPIIQLSGLGRAEIGFNLDQHHFLSGLDANIQWERFDLMDITEIFRSIEINNGPTAYLAGRQYSASSWFASARDWQLQTSLRYNTQEEPDSGSLYSFSVSLSGEYDLNAGPWNKGNENTPALHASLNNLFFELLLDGDSSTATARIDTNEISTRGVKRSGSNVIMLTIEGMPKEVFSYSPLSSSNATRELLEKIAGSDIEITLEAPMVSISRSITGGLFDVDTAGRAQILYSGAGLPQQDRLDDSAPSQISENWLNQIEIIAEFQINPYLMMVMGIPSKGKQEPGAMQRLHLEGSQLYINDTHIWSF